MADKVTTVLSFLDAISGNADDFARAVERWFTSATIWENIGMSRVAGPSEAQALMSKMAAVGIAGLRVETPAIAVHGGTVLTERIDHLLDESGAVLRSIPVMGAFDVDEDGKIVRWSDYFDTNLFRPST
ncbi:limonene-1,2-epoxide hydrolase family protein [Sphingobium tyrosinilyticum]|uniref:Limonene-1,2-epoxide hydrolase family protein n=1 Tax=Sphingobium tyrosinilyticum TaxID=2715436 RepID=A0ABV9F3R1_9SPHN